MLAVPKPTKRRKEPRPPRDEFELQELAESLEMAREEGKTLNFVIWRNSDPLRGTIERMDPNTKTVHIKELYGEIRKVPFLDILRVGDTEY
ncbi:YolD-like family protein [Paenibacillus illinoisensis]|uniref:YolD-like family protein n=1 Tax=Paenibacillus illinoisensis TaxID=59845 RepID=UPI003A4D8D58